MKKRIILAIILVSIMAAVNMVPVLADSQTYSTNETWTDRVYDKKSGTDYTLDNWVKTTTVIYDDGAVKTDIFWKYTGTGTYLGQVVEADGKDQFIYNTHTGNGGVFYESQKADGTLGGAEFSYKFTVKYDGEGNVLFTHELLSGVPYPQ